MIQIETVKGLENVEEIVKVKGIDAVIIGPSDLSGSMGYPGNPEHADVKKAIDKIIKVTKGAGIALDGAGSVNKEVMAEAQRNGFLLFTINPAAFIIEQCKQLVSGIKDTFIS